MIRPPISEERHQMASINDLPASTLVDVPRLHQQIAALEQQLAEQQQAMVTLGDSEARWRRLTECTHEGVALSYQGIVLDANDRFGMMMGCDRADLIGMPAIDTVVSDDVERVRAHQQAGDESPYLVHMRRINGSTFLAECWGKAVPYEGKLARVTVLRDLSQQEHAEAALRERDRRWVQFMDALPIGVLVSDPTGAPVYANAIAQQLLGQGTQLPLAQLAASAQLYRAEMDQIYPTDQLPLVQALGGVRVAVDDVEIRREARALRLEVTAVPLLDEQGQVMNAVGLFQDITERQGAVAALRQLLADEATIKAQAAALRELSTPLIPISERAVVMPLIGAVDAARAQEIMETLLAGVATHRADVAIVDITGVSVVDTQVANALLQAARAVRLLGAQVVLTGIRPEVAQTLVGLGVELQGLVTRSTLQSGIAYALHQGG
jgi:rsbT co-antagonist protein RsbR